MVYNKSSVKRAVDASGDNILTFTDGAGAHIQAVTDIRLQDVNDIAEVGDITYVGIEDADGEWLLKQIDESSGLSIRYATESNNPSYTTYSGAWAARATLTYEHYSDLF